MAVLNRSVGFFERQFGRQVADSDFVLNPFEELALPHLRRSVLDLGCGLGNLSVEAARRGCRVRAVDASPTAVEHVKAVAASERLPVEAIRADLATFEIEGTFDAVVSIGLLMFLREDAAHAVLRRMKQAVRPGGIAVVNVLVEGTTYMEMFDPDAHYLFGERELEGAFGAWEIVESCPYTASSPGDTVKVFRTVIARAPDGGAPGPVRTP